MQEVFKRRRAATYKGRQKGRFYRSLPKINAVMKREFPAEATAWIEGDAEFPLRLAGREPFTDRGHLLLPFDIRPKESANALSEPEKRTPPGAHFVGEVFLKRTPTPPSLSSGMNSMPAASRTVRIFC